MNIEKAKDFIIHNARPLELSLYQYFYKHSDKEKVLSELRKFQNKDGGFGNGLEADNWNPNSNPIATNDALITLYRIQSLERDNEIVNGIIKYLSSHDSFDEEKRRWLFAVDSNEQYPHAIWWKKDGDGISHYNPTVSLAAFMVCFGDDGNREYYSQIVKEAFSVLFELEKWGDELKCYMLAHQMLAGFGINNVIDLSATQREIESKLAEIICTDTTKYGVEYVPVPSDFFPGIYKEFLTEALNPVITAEMEVLGKIQNQDGGFDISWQWYTDYKEFETARDWWRPRITLDKLLFWDYLALPGRESRLP